MKHGLFAELKRRHVYRVAAAYAVVGWLVIQLASTVLPTFGAPDWVLKTTIALLVIGFPVALVLAWAFEMTPDGVRRTEPADSAEARAPEVHHKVGRSLDRVIIGVLVLALVLSVWRPWHTHHAHSKPLSAATTAPTAAAGTSTKAAAPPAPEPAASSAIPAKSIAVLPFENLSSDKDNAYFADGMQDLILTKLADIGDLKVISRTSTMQYGSHPQNLTKIGKELGVATLLEGSVQKAGDQVLVNVQLIDARTDAHLWAESYQRTLKNVFGVEGEVAGKIANALNAKLSPAETRSLASQLSDDPEANILYLRAQHELDDFASTGLEHLKQAIVLYRDALARAPGFALAHARLSYAESWLAFRGGGGEDIAKLTTDANAQAKLSLKLAPNLPESHLAMGYVEYYGKGDYDSALDAFAVASHLRPNDAAVYAASGYVLRRQGKFGLAAEALSHAQTLDPNDRNISWDLAVTYMALGRYDEAGTTFRNALALQPDNALLRFWYAQYIMFATGNLDRVEAVVKGQNDLMAVLRIGVLVYQHKYALAISKLSAIPATSTPFSPGVKELTLAQLYYYAGDMIHARMHAAKAFPLIRAQVQALSGHPDVVTGVWSDLATAQLILGHTKDGIAAIKASLAAGKASGDRFEYPNVVLEAAQAYALAGRPDKALALLSRALSMPGIDAWFSPVMLWIDPDWDPIRKTPGFQALLKKYARYQPPLQHYPAPSTSSTGA